MTAQFFTGNSGDVDRIRNWTNPAPQIRNPKSQIGLWLKPASVQFEVSDFGFEVQDSSNFEFGQRHLNSP